MTEDAAEEPIREPANDGRVVQLSTNELNEYFLCALCFVRWQMDPPHPPLRGRLERDARPNPRTHPRGTSGTRASSPRPSAAARGKH
jgi:hypothetical protein